MDVTHSGSLKILLIIALLHCITGCKISVVAPEHADVISTTSDFHCTAGNICTLDVNDLKFDENFWVKPKQGYYFKRWKKRPHGLCGGTSTHCHIESGDLNAYPDLLPILESDEVYFLEPEIQKAGDNWETVDQALTRVDDPNLRACIEHNAKSYDVVYANALYFVICSHGHPENFDTVYSLSGIEAFKSLLTVSLAKWEFADLSALSSLIHLKKLYLASGNLKGLTDINALANLSKLEWLYIEDLVDADLAPLRPLKSVKRLFLGSRTPIRDLTVLEEMKKLKALHILYTPIQRLDGLSNLSSLELIRLWGVTFEDSTALSTLPSSTETIDIRFAKGEINFHHLANQTQITYLDLRQNEIEDISFISNFTNLWLLNLSHNKITNLLPLKGLSNLSHLNLSGNEIESLDGIPLNLGVTSIDLRENPLDCEEVKSFLRKVGSPASVRYDACD